MRRRDFLSLLGAAPLAVALARRARGDVALDGVDDATRDPHNPTLAEAHAAARRRGVPLFVIIIPAKTESWWQHGTAWGELLNHGADADVAPLARSEVACATLAQLGAYGATGDGAEPLAVLLPTDGTAPRLLRAELPALPGRVRLADGKSDDAVIAERIAVLSGLIRDALGAPANARAQAAVVKERIVTRPPAGSHWATGGGCGTTVEETPEEKLQKALAAERRRRAAKRGEYAVMMSSVSTIGCGMGHVPEKSRRFLNFYAGKAEL